MHLVVQIISLVAYRHIYGVMQTLLVSDINLMLNSYGCQEHSEQYLLELKIIVSEVHISHKDVTTLQPTYHLSLCMFALF